MTGKGDRWERDRQGRSEPAFQVPAPPHSLHQPALHGERPANICGCCFAARPVPAGSSAAVYYKASAGRIIRRLCLPAVALFSRLCLPDAFAMPTALIISLPLFCFDLPPPPVHFHVRQDRRNSLQELSRWQLQRGSAVAARAPCCIHPPFSVLQGLPCRQPRQETAFAQLMRRCSLQPCKKGETLDCV